MGEIKVCADEDGEEPLGNRNNKASCWWKRFDVVRLRHPFIRRGHSLSPGVSPDG